MGVQVVESGESKFEPGEEIGAGRRRSGMVYGGEGEFCTLTVTGEEQGGAYHIYPHSTAAESLATDGFKSIGPREEIPVGTVKLRGY